MSIKTRFLILAATLVLAGCASPGGLHVETPAANTEGSMPGSRPRPALGMDEPTRKTYELLAAAGATKLDGLKPMQHDMGKMGGMEGMDHSKMSGMKSGGEMEGMDHSTMPAIQGPPKGQQKPAGMEGIDHSNMRGMKGGGDMQGMDHSKMPGMKGDSTPPAAGGQPPTDKKAVAEEMKRLSDEMKKTSDELKKKSDAAEKPADPTPQP